MLAACLIITVLLPGKPAAENRLCGYRDLATCQDAERGVILKVKDPRVIVVTRCVDEAGA